MGSRRWHGDLLPPPPHPHPPLKAFLPVYLLVLLDASVWFSEGKDYQQNGINVCSSSQTFHRTGRKRRQPQWTKSCKDAGVPTIKQMPPSRPPVWEHSSDIWQVIIPMPSATVWWFST